MDNTPEAKGGDLTDHTKCLMISYDKELAKTSHGTKGKMSGKYMLFLSPISYQSCFHLFHVQVILDLIY